jgi:hypothetical protein
MNHPDNFVTLPFTRNHRLLEALAWLLPLSLAGGSDFVLFEWMGVSWYAFRVLVLFAATIALVDIVLVKRKVQGWQLAMLLFFSVWLLWAVFNRPEGIHSTDWMKGVFYLVIAAATLLSFYYLSIVRMQKTLVQASVAGFVVNLVVSVVQMLTSIRPASNFATELANYSSEHFIRFAPSGMFGNPNHFAFYVCAQLFVIYTFRQHLSFTLRMVLYVMGGLLILLTQSRVGMSVSVLLMLLMIIENRNWVRIQAAPAMRPVLYTLFFAVLLIASTEWVNTRSIALVGEAMQRWPLQDKPTGDMNRMSLIRCGWEMIQSSNFRGVGAGQFAQATQDMGCALGGISNPHCGFIELTAEAGILVFALLVFALVYFLWQSRRKTFFLQALVWTGMLCLLQFANSSFISIPIAWCFLAWPFLIAYSETEEIT